VKFGGVGRGEMLRWARPARISLLAKPGAATRIWAGDLRGFRGAGGPRGGGLRGFFFFQFLPAECDGPGAGRWLELRGGKFFVSVRGLQGPGTNSRAGSPALAGGGAGGSGWISSGDVAGASTRGARITCLQLL